MKEFNRLEIDPPVQSNLKDVFRNFNTEVPNFIGTLLKKGYSENIKYIIQTPNKSFVLRNYKNNETLPKLRREADLLAYLKSEGFPIPLTIKTKTKNNIYTNGDGLWTMSEYVEGYCAEHPHTLADAQLIAAGTLLGYYHQIVEHYPNVQKGDIAWHVEPHGLRNLLNRVASIIEMKSQHDEIDQMIATIIPHKLQRLEDLREANTTIATQPKLQTHGDFHGANIIFGQNNNIKSLIDWEDSSYWMRVAEVQASICMMCKEDATEHFNAPINFRRSKLFLNAYEAIYPLTTKEKMLMPTISQLDSLRLDFLLYRHYVLSQKDHDTFIPKDLAHWFWWDNHAEEYAKKVLTL